MPGSPAHKKTQLGLDLQGGLEVVLQAVPPKDHKITTADLDRSVTIMRNRIDKLGVAEPEIRKQGSDQIVIQLAGVHDPAKAAELIGKTAQLEFYDLQADLTGPSAGTQGFVRYPIATASVYNLLAGQQAKAKEGTPTAYYLFDKNKKLIAGPTDTRERLFNASTRRCRRAGRCSRSRRRPSSSPARRRPRTGVRAPTRASGRPTTTSSSTTRRTRTRISASPR